MILVHSFFCSVHNFGLHLYNICEGWNVFNCRFLGLLVLTVLEVGIIFGGRILIFAEERSATGIF